MKQQVQELKIVLDESRQQKKVAEITETDYFKSLQGEADSFPTHTSESPQFSASSFLPIAVGNRYLPKQFDIERCRSIY